MVVTFRPAIAVTLLSILLAAAALVALRPPAATAQAPVGTIAYARASTESEIRLIEPNGTNDRRLWLDSAPDPYETRDIWDLSWRPDAGELAFTGTHENSCSMNFSDVYAIQPSGSGYRRITQAPACAALASMPKGTVRVPVENATYQSFSGFVYFQGAASAQVVNLPPRGSTMLTFANVADAGSGEVQVGVEIVGIEREYHVGTAVDVLPNSTVTTGTMYVGSVTNSFLEPRSVTWHRSGGMLGYAYGYASLYRIAAQPTPLDFGEQLANLSDGPDIVLFMAYGPTAATASKVLFQGWDFSSDGIYLINEGATTVGQPLVTAPSGTKIKGLAWLPDGSGFVYTQSELDSTYTEAASNVYRYSFATAQSTKLTHFPNQFAKGITVSPDGQRIAFDRSPTVDIGPQTSVWVMAINGSGLAQLASDAYAPAWSQVALPGGGTSTPTRTPTTGPSLTPTRTPTTGPSLTPTRTPTVGPSLTPTQTPPPGTQQFVAGFGLRSGANETVTSVVRAPDGTIYAGGQFIQTGGNARSYYVARWNGSSWSALGTGANARVAALVVGTDNSLYAGGEFTQAGGVAASRVARWNGSSWSALGSGTSSNVNTLSVSGGMLYAGGAFTQAGGVPASRVARWNGSSWSALGSGTSGAVHALAPAPDGTLYVGGEFGTAGDVATNNVARWNGSSWSALGGPSGSGTDQSVYGLAVAADGTLFASGEFMRAGGVVVNRIARWAGNAWQPLMAPSGDGINGRVNAVAIAPDGTLYAGGFFSQAGATTASNIARWNGSSWSTLAGPSGEGVNGEVFALAVGPDGTLYAGGDFTTAGGVTVNRIARWNGSSWSTVGAAGANGRVSALAANSNGLIAGGNFSQIGGVAANRIAQFNGSSWGALGSGANAQVSAVLVAPDGLYVGGEFTQIGGIAANRIARWNGGWSTLGSGLNNPARALARAADGTLYVGGDFTQAGGVAANRIARWNGSAWSALGSGANGSLFALAVDGSGTLFAGGHFDVIGGISTDSIARYHPTSGWAAMGATGVGITGTTVNQPVRTLAARGTQLWIGGDFDEADRLPSANIALYGSAQPPVTVTPTATVTSTPPQATMTPTPTPPPAGYRLFLPITIK